MKTLKTLALSLLAVFAALALSTPAIAQTNTLAQTKLTAAMTATQLYAPVSSATGIVAGYDMLVDGELLNVAKTYNGTALNVPVTRYSAKVTAHANGAMVLSGKPSWFQTYDPVGGCTLANTFVTPWVNVNVALSGGLPRQWLCSSIGNQWVPGFGNNAASDQVTTAVASAAGLITPSGPLFHVTGALAITGFNVPVGLGSATGGFCIIPDGAFTTTTANNIAIASTAVVSRVLCYTYDPNAAKPFFPSY